MASRAAVVLDLDGTLVDSATVIVGILNGMLAERGRVASLDVAGMKHALSSGGEVLVQHALGPGGDDELKRELAEFRRRYAELPTPPSSLYPGAREAIGALRDQGVALAVCTKKPERLARKVLQDLGLLEAFEVVSGGDSEPHPKPDPRHLDAVLAALGADGNASLYVGDSDVDWRMAQAHGIRFVFARYGYDDGQVPADACFATVDTLADLPSLATRN